MAAEPEHNEDRTEARPDALPIGLQIVGDHFQEALLLRIAATYEKETKFNTNDRRCSSPAKIGITMRQRSSHEEIE